MKKLYLLSLFALLQVFIVNAQECSPSLAEFYSFDIGSVFQYHTLQSGNAGGNISTTHIIERYTVTGKWTNNDTLEYVREGTRQTYTEYEINFEPVRKYTEDFTDTITIVDSSTHFLNACDSDLVYVGLYNDFYSRVYVDTLDGIPAKKVGGFVGGQNNLFEYNDDDSLVAVIAYQYEEVALKGIGLKSREELIFESSEDKLLEGYVIDGDTTGTIWSDEDFITSVENSNKAENAKIYPTVLRNRTFHIESEERISEIKVYSLDGKLQPYQRLTNSAFKLNRATPGTYFVVVYYKQDVSINRVVIP